MGWNSAFVFLAVLVLVGVGSPWLRRRNISPFRALVPLFAAGGVFLALSVIVLFVRGNDQTALDLLLDLVVVILLAILLRAFIIKERRKGSDI
jgi:hypothetical protein